jgi:hypothetical protein
VSYPPPPEPRDDGLDRAREMIAHEEQYADNMNLLREERRAHGGGPLRRALRRMRDRLRPTQKSS